MPKGRTLILIAVGAAAVTSIAIHFTVGFGGSDTALFRPDDPAIVARGAEVYTAQCASCHGAQLRGQPNWREQGPDGMLPAPPHDASGHTWHHADEQLFRITKFGVARTAGLKDYKSAMPVYENLLSDADIIAALSWIKAQWPADIRKKHDAMNARAANAAR